MSADKQKLQDDLDSLNAQITKQGSHIRELKKEGKAATDEKAQKELDDAIEKLKALKMESATKTKELETLGGSGSGGNKPFDRKVFDDVLVRKMFVIPSFEIHGGVKGLFDLGPPACSLKAAMIDIWRKHFVLSESMLEMECTCLTPEVVLKTSGHVDRFTDLMVKDNETGDCYRADKLLEDGIDAFIEKNKDKFSAEEKEVHYRIQRQADAFPPEELDKLLLEYNCVSPSNGKPFSKSFPFNLMFKTSIGPEGTSVGYLRPETAQGLFVNFRRLLDLNANKMPFAAAQIGLGFRNEIAPRSGLLRVREFCMAEIEHFVNPVDKAHVNFKSIANENLVLFGRDDQLGSGKTRIVTAQEAVHGSTPLIANETLAYFMTRTKLYMLRIGMDETKLRFRQHLKTEMAHYATDCWDLEIQTSYGWIECVGHADRACYDLDVHSKATKTPMIANIMLDEPETIEIAKLKFDRKLLGKTFQKDQRIVSSILEKYAEDYSVFESKIVKPFETNDTITISEEDCEGKQSFEITKEMVTWTKTSKTIHEKKFTPSVIEPSFGMGRILYSLLEHSFYQREGDEQRTVMKFNIQVAPQKIVVLPISSSEETNVVVDQITAELIDNDIATRSDKSSAALGRRYSRADELGIPYAVTVDFQTLQDKTITLRERDSTCQIRIAIADLSTIIIALMHNKTSWEELTKKYPLIQQKEEGGEQPTGATVVESTSRGKFSRPAVPITK